MFAHHAHQAADDSASQPREDWAAAAAADGHQAADDGGEEDKVFDGVLVLDLGNLRGQTSRKIGSSLGADNARSRETSGHT